MYTRNFPIHPVILLWSWFSTYLYLQHLQLIEDHTGGYPSVHCQSCFVLFSLFFLKSSIIGLSHTDNSKICTVPSSTFLKYCTNVSLSHLFRCLIPLHCSVKQLLYCHTYTTVDFCLLGHVLYHFYLTSFHFLLLQSSLLCSPPFHSSACSSINSSCLSYNSSWKSIIHSLSDINWIWDDYYYFLYTDFSILTTPQLII